MRILLLYPWYPHDSVTTFEESLGILYLAAALLHQGHGVDLADLTFRKGLGGLEDRIRAAELVGVSATAPLFGTTARIGGRIRELNPAVTTVIGGPHATVDATAALGAGFGVAVIGEGEAAILELADTLGARASLERVRGIAYREGEEVQWTSHRPFIPDLDTIAFPARRFIDYSRHRRLEVLSMRGCPFRCTRCKSVEEKLLGKRLRQRSLENVVEEIHDLVRRYGNRPVTFKDDTLTAHDADWFSGLSTQFARRKLRVEWQCVSRVDSVDLHKLAAMKEAGCRQIFWGIQSGSRRILGCRSRSSGHTAFVRSPLVVYADTSGRHAGRHSTRRPLRPVHRPAPSDRTLGTFGA